jgi:hypothetical protein
MWKTEREDAFFRIFDKDHKIAGYFDPDYGQIFPEDKIEETIERMHKNHDAVPGGFLTIPMVKFEIFDSNEGMDVLYLATRLEEVNERVGAWKEFLLANKMQHSISISHTDQDMLSLTFPIKFASPVSLEKKHVLEAILPTLDLLQQKGLL